MWKTGGPDSSEIATPKRVRTNRPKHSDTICCLVDGGSIWQNKKSFCFFCSDHAILSLCVTPTHFSSTSDERQRSSKPWPYLFQVCTLAMWPGEAGQSNASPIQMGIFRLYLSLFLRFSSERQKIFVTEKLNFFTLFCSSLSLFSLSRNPTLTFRYLSISLDALLWHLVALTPGFVVLLLMIRTLVVVRHSF